MSSPTPPASMLTDCELAVIRDVATLALDTPITITHVTRTPTAAGYAEATSLLASCNAAFKVPSAPILTQYANKIANMQAWVVSLPYTVTLPSIADRITVTSDGSTYVVHAILQPQSFSSVNGVLVGRVVGG